MTNLKSKKLIISLFAIIACVYTVYITKQCGYNAVETVIIVPSIVLAISIICVTYLTGQAKIDIKESISVGGSSARQNNQ